MGHEPRCAAGAGVSPHLLIAAYYDAAAAHHRALAHLDDLAARATAEQRAAAERMVEDRRQLRQLAFARMKARNQET